MYNRFWWQRSERGIRLSHLRYEAPVELFELLPQGDGRWLTAEPHLCGADHDSAELTEIRWRFFAELANHLGRARTSGSAIAICSDAGLQA